MHNLAAITMEASSQISSNIPSTKQETTNQPFDVTLVVEDGKEFKAHRRVLSEASPFFEKLLNSDMRESNEGVVRLEMITEACIKYILEFIYRGSVEISTEDNARDLVAMADYLVLPHLKTLAEKALVNDLELNVFNCILMYNFAERYDCGELKSFCKTFVLGNFTSVTKTEQFLNLPSKEVKMWISSDEIDVSAEEDVFKIILAWIEREKSERKKYFAELFREVRLVYVSRDFLQSDVVTNDLVNNNEACVNLVKDALKLTDRKSCHHLNSKPRKSLETHVIVVCLKCAEKMDQIICCYYPHEEKWLRIFGKAPLHTSLVTSCSSKLYFISQQEHKLLCYDSFSNSWDLLPYKEQRRLEQVFVKNDEIYALLSEDQLSCLDCVALHSHGRFQCDKRHLSFLMKYKPVPNTWEEISSFHLDSRVGICVVAKDSFIYLLGGYSEGQFETLADADRYDLSSNTWEKIADLQEPRQNASGAAAHEKIFVAGGINKNDISKTCEVYSEATNEWQFIARFDKTQLDKMYSPALLCVNNTLYLLMRYLKVTRYQFEGEIGCLYELHGDEWKLKTEIPSETMLSTVGTLKKTCFITSSSSMKSFKGQNFLEQATFPKRHNCVIM